MSNVRLLEEKIGGCWTGVRFDRNGAPSEDCSERSMRFCAAIADSRKGRLILSPDSIACPGARRSFGWNEDIDAMADLMSGKANIDSETARNIIQGTPKLTDEIHAVVIGTEDSPDVFISYAQPEAAMKITRLWQRVYGQDLEIKTSSFMAVCGNVAVSAHLTGRLCLSFGCPDSRDSGRFGRDRLAVGIPCKLVEELLAEDSRLLGVAVSG